MSAVRLEVPFYPNGPFTNQNGPKLYLYNQLHFLNMKDYWSETGSSHTARFNEAQIALAGMLSRDLVAETVAIMDSDYKGGIEWVDIFFAQIGFKCAVYHIADNIQGGDYHFMVILARGRGALSREVRVDFANLAVLRQRLIENGLPVFVPQPYILSECDGISAFSVEHLPGLAEVNSIKPSGDIPYSDVKAHSYFFDLAADEFTISQKMGHRGLSEKLGRLEQSDEGRRKRMIHEDASYRIARRLKTELVARLYIVYKLMGALPAELCINAGDFMVDLDAENYDLHLTTVRGGFCPVLSDESFFYRLLEHREPDNQGYLLFDGDTAILEEGIYKGKTILGEL